MDRSREPASDHAAARAFARVGVPKLWARLLRYATERLHLAAIDAESAGVVEAGDAVNALIVAGLSGDLVWTLRADATDDQIVEHACRKLFGMRSNLRKVAARSAGDDPLDELADGTPDAFAMLLQRQTVAEARRAFPHDAEASTHLRLMLDGKTRADIVDELGCTAEQANAVRKRIVRGLEALGAAMNDDGEDEPQSSGPRATPGAARSARRAGRRR
jgi:hypothetical protein